MEKRIGTALIHIESRENIALLNDIISNHSPIILGRQGLPHSKNHSIISLVFEGTTDEIGSLTGQLGRLKGIQVKSVLLKNKE
jgi:putative iron-only hydrogenase system regulator